MAASLKAIDLRVLFSHKKVHLALSLAASNWCLDRVWVDESSGEGSNTDKADVDGPYLEIDRSIACPKK